MAGVVEWLLLLFFGCGQCLEIEWERKGKRERERERERTRERERESKYIYINWEKNKVWEVRFIVKWSGKNDKVTLEIVKWDF